MTHTPDLTTMQGVKEAAADCVPSNWLDSLLTGPNKVLPGSGKYSGPDIERLLNAIRERIRSLELPSQWRAISEAPKDGTRFLAWQNGEVYEARFTEENTPRLCFRTHDLFVSERYRIVETLMDGELVKAHVPVEKPWTEEFQHKWTLWTKGFEFEPTHFMPLPSPPTEGEKK